MWILHLILLRNDNPFLGENKADKEANLQGPEKMGRKIILWVALLPLLGAWTSADAVSNAPAAKEEAPQANVVMALVGHEGKIVTQNKNLCFLDGVDGGYRSLDYVQDYFDETGTYSPAYFKEGVACKAAIVLFSAYGSYHTMDPKAAIENLEQDYLSKHPEAQEKEEAYTPISAELSKLRSESEANRIAIDFLVQTEK